MYLIGIEHFVLPNEIRACLGIASCPIDECRRRPFRECGHDCLDDSLHFGLFKVAQTLAQEFNQQPGVLKRCGIVGGHHQDILFLRLQAQGIPVLRLKAGGLHTTSLCAGAHARDRTFLLKVQDILAFTIGWGERRMLCAAAPAAAAISGRIQAEKNGRNRLDNENSPGDGTACGVLRRRRVTTGNPRRAPDVP